MSAQEIFKNRFHEVKRILVILSTRGMVFDCSALKHQIHFAYPGAEIVFQPSVGTLFQLGHGRQPIDLEAIDLLIDFTPPGQSQCFYAIWKLRKKVRFAVGRAVGLIRNRHYDRIFKEQSWAQLPITEWLSYERLVQKQVLALAGVSFVQSGTLAPDLSHEIALQLPGMQTI